eukprot:CAMPEP_0178588510 /NCGR_PEP_ID=MMETSP0697-20121206/27073_1 /TAXON_ID=265572 /ORGANISM="Extubocellulus spinifer, Strain CCMP396" /LENGTH=400 /DNA_ID=CAMNT_0020224867 /DNA_START=176 /DNA_END=1378 /DNA_ORIENTATION=-
MSQEIEVTAGGKAEAERVIIALTDVDSWNTTLSLTKPGESAKRSEAESKDDAAFASAAKENESGITGRSTRRSSQGGYAMSIRRDTIALVDDKGEEYDLAHKFSDHTYKSPTNCDICSGLLVGLWSQGLQCAMCGINCHRGEGIGDHDDCLGEAMLAPCGCIQSSSSTADEANKTLGEAIREVRELAQEKPNFFQEVRAQMDKDVMTHVTNAIVSEGVEGQRAKNFRRIKEKLTPLLCWLDDIQAKGELYSLLILLKLHFKIAFLAGLIGLVGWVLAMVWRHGSLTKSSFHMAVIHESTVLVTIHIALLLIAGTFRYYAGFFKRKAIVIDQFLKDKFGIDAKVDIGISVAGAANRARWWSERILFSAAITSYIELCLWFAVQPSMETLLYVDHGVCPAKE